MTTKTVTVPVEPTDEMLRAVWNAYLSDAKGGLGRFAITYQAMLAAAPSEAEQRTAAAQTREPTRINSADDSAPAAAPLTVEQIVPKPLGFISASTKEWINGPTGTGPAIFTPNRNGAGGAYAIYLHDEKFEELCNLARIGLQCLNAEPVAFVGTDRIDNGIGIEKEQKLRWEQVDDDDAPLIVKPRMK